MRHNISVADKVYTPLTGRAMTERRKVHAASVAELKALLRESRRAIVASEILVRNDTTVQLHAEHASRICRGLPGAALAGWEQLQAAPALLTLPSAC